MSQSLGQTLRQTRFVDVARMAMIGNVEDALSPVAVAISRDVAGGLVSIRKVMMLDPLPGASQTPGVKSRKAKGTIRSVSEGLPHPPRR